jgi:hypothetical protein
MTRARHVRRFTRETRSMCPTGSGRLPCGKLVACARLLCAHQLHVHVISSVPDHNTDNGTPVTHPGGEGGGAGERRPRSGARPRSLIASLKHANGSLMMLVFVWCVFV